jgi:ribosomal protein S18 acetylase RimI-like enzyme
MITLHKASLKDATMLSTLAKDIYKEHYLHLWLADGAEWYMDTHAYAVHKIEKELANENNEYIIAVDNGNYVGYLKLVLNAKLSTDEHMNAMEVERIYLHKTAMGKGLGTKLMEYALEKARELKKEIIFLKAMDTSTEAIGFYKKAGYSICGSLQLPLPEYSLMKQEYRGMVILKRTV